MLNSKSLISIQILIFTALLGCGQEGFRAVDKSSTFADPATTGHETDVTTITGQRVTVNYLPGGDLDILRDMESHQGPKYSAKLAQNIKTVDVNDSSEQGQNKFKISVQLDSEPKPLVFAYDVSSDKSTGDIETPQSEPTPGANKYKLKSKCITDSCQRMQMSLLKVDDKGQLKEEASFSYSKANSKVRAIVAENDRETTPEVESVVEKLKDAVAEKKTVNVLGGVSYSEIEIKESMNQTPILSVRTKNTDTREATGEVDSIKLKEEEVTGSGRTTGLDPVTGSLALNIEMNAKSDPKKGVRARIYMPVALPELAKQVQPQPPAIKPPQTVVPQDAPPATVIPPPPQDQSTKSDQVVDTKEMTDAQLAALYESSIIPIEGTTGKPIDFSLDMAKKLEAYRNLDEVLEYIDYWKGEKTHLHCKTKKTYYGPRKANDYLRNIPTVAPVITNAMNLIDAPSMISNLMIMESPFYQNFKGKIYDANIVTMAVEDGRKSDAGGPYQMLTDTAIEMIEKYDAQLTALGFNLKVFYTTSIERDAAKKYNLKSRTAVLRKLGVSSEEYAKHNRSLTNDDARNYLATAALLTGLYGKELMQIHHKDGTKTPKDPALMPIAYRVGPGTLQSFEKSTPCNKIQSAFERNQCEAEAIADLEFVKRHEGFNPSFADVLKYKMASCTAIDYALAFLSITYITSNPCKYGFCKVADPAVSDVNHVIDSIVPDKQMADLLNINLPKEASTSVN